MLNALPDIPTACIIVSAASISSRCSKYAHPTFKLSCAVLLLQK